MCVRTNLAHQAWYNSNIFYLLPFQILLRETFHLHEDAMIHRPLYGMLIMHPSILITKVVILRRRGDSQMSITV